MSSMIDVESLLSNLSADAPCGVDLEYDPRVVEMEKLAQGTPERQYGNTIIPAEPPDWRGVSKAALDVLERARDLRAAMYLARSLLNTDGLPGFADGLKLLEGLIERHWDQVYPQLDPDDDNDPTLRINTLLALCDAETTLHELLGMGQRLLATDAGEHPLLDVRRLRLGEATELKQMTPGHG